jgi:hypothetical protein
MMHKLDLVFVVEDVRTGRKKMNDFTTALDAYTEALLQQANVMQGRQAEPLALLTQELNRINAIDAPQPFSNAYMDRVMRLSEVVRAMSLIKELQAKANGI